MGFRFRKSTPIGKHFRINLSKSGVGYSWGVKGARFTKTANGKNRTTLSAPGTGISYTTESKAHTSKKKLSKKKNIDQAAASAKQQVQQTAGAQNPPTNSAPTKSSPNITSFKTTYPVLFWIIAIAIWPISLSIWFLKTDNIKKLNKTARICLLAAFWIVFCTIGGIAGTQKGPGDIRLSDPISKSLPKHRRLRLHRRNRLRPQSRLRRRSRQTRLFPKRPSRLQHHRKHSKVHKTTASRRETLPVPADKPHLSPQMRPTMF